MDMLPLDVGRRQMVGCGGQQDAIRKSNSLHEGGSTMKKLALFTAVAVLAWAVEARAETVKLQVVGAY
jgi:hypothetical protein